MSNGVGPAEFWRLTPHQTSILATRFGIDNQERLRLVHYGAWATARLERAKKFPTLEEWMEPHEETPKDSGGGDVVNDIRRVMGELMERQNNG